MDEFDDEDQNTDDLFSFGRKIKIDLADMDYVSWRDSLVKDAEVLELLTVMVADITPEHDSKLQELYKIIDEKISNPINEGNKKIIIFTAFADTAGYLYDNVSEYVKSKYGLNTAMVSGSVDGRTTCPKLRGDLNTVLTCFSPISKGRDLFDSIPKEDIDIVAIGTKGRDYLARRLINLRQNLSQKESRYIRFPLSAVRVSENFYSM